MGIEATMPIETPIEVVKPPIMERLKRVAAIGAIVAVSAFGIEACSDDSNSKQPVAEASADTATASSESEEICADPVFSPEAANSKKYTDEAFLPKGDFADAKGVQSYVEALFNGNGPLAESTDPVSLAAITALVTIPAHDGKATSPDYSYTKAFADRVAAYGAEGGTEAAAHDCAVTRDTLIATAEYNGKWAQKGATVIKATALRNDNYALNGMEFKEYVSTGTLAGIELKLRDTTKGLDDFYTVLITNSGEMFLIGPNANQGKKAELSEGEMPTGTNKVVSENGGESQNESTGGNQAGGGEPHGEGEGCQGVGQGCEGTGPGPGEGPGGPGGGPENPGTTPGTTTENPTTTRPPVTTTTRPPVVTTTTRPQVTTTTRTTMPPKEPPSTTIVTPGY